MRSFVKNALVKVKKLHCQIGGNGGFGLNELLGTAAAIIIAAFVVIPGLRSFAGDVMSGLSSWWTGSVMSSIFPAS